MTDNLLDMEEVLVQKIEDARFMTRKQEYINIHMTVKLCNKNCFVYLQTLLTSHIDYCAFVVCYSTSLNLMTTIPVLLFVLITFLERLQGH